MIVKTTLRGLSFGVLFLLLLVGCNKKNESVDITAQSNFLAMDYFGSCFYGAASFGLNEVVINDDVAYQALGNAIRTNYTDTNCTEAQLPFIDFTVYTLIGKMCAVGGCGADFKRNISHDVKNKTIVYRISPSYIGICSALFMDMNWVLIPKIADDYTVEFIVDEAIVQLD